MDTKKENKILTESKKLAKHITKISGTALELVNPLNLTRINTKTTNKRVGKSPGTLIYTGKEKKEEVTIEIIDYTEKKVYEKETTNTNKLEQYKNKNSTTWINITGIHNTKLIEEIGKKFGLDSLVLEDIVNQGQRPKTEEYQNYQFTTMKMIRHEEETNKIRTEQLSIIQGKNYVITFQETKGDVFEPLRQRIRQKRVRLKHPDYLAYALIDLIVDNYFVVLEEFGEQLTTIEEKLMKHTQPEILNTIYSLKRELIILRKYMQPLREVINTLNKTGTKHIRKETKNYVQDVYDHQIQVLDTIDTYRDMLSGLQDLYLSIAGNKMNEVMKVLTIIATIFIPITFIAGIYGMNFEYMPELQYTYAYPTLWGIILLTAGIMIYYFKKKKWM